MKENESEETSAAADEENPAGFIYAVRNDYRARNLEKQTARRDPFEQFEIWLAEAIAEKLEDPNAMVLSTASAAGRPSSRIVLLRGFDQRGFVFFTNYNSLKGAQIAENPQGSLLVYWAELERQVRLDGSLTKTSRRVSEEYFATRPRESQLGAWSSAQSEVIESRRDLEERLAETERRFAGKDVPCPDFWGGYLLNPDSFEFWQGRPSRLHDRLRYLRAESGWKLERLSP